MALVTNDVPSCAQPYAAPTQSRRRSKRSTHFVLPRRAGGANGVRNRYFVAAGTRVAVTVPLSAQKSVVGWRHE